MTIPDRLEKQRLFHSNAYARRLVMNKDLLMPDFKLRARLYGDEWKNMIWRLCKELKGINR